MRFLKKFIGKCKDPYTATRSLAFSFVLFTRAIS